VGGGGYYLSRGDGSGRIKVNKGEVSRLCEHFNIKADNPCAVLTQEHAKKFLHGNNNEVTLYDFFLEASNLKDMKEKHQQTLSMIEKAKADVEAAEAKLPMYEEAAAKAKAEYDGAVALKRMDAQLEELEKVGMWACIADREKRLEAQSAAEAEAEADLRKNTQEYSAARDEFKAQEKALQEAQAEADDLMKQAQDASSSGKALLEAQNKRKKSIKLAQRAATTARDEGQALEEQIAQAKLRLDGYLEDLEKNQQTQRAALERDRLEAEEEVAALQRAIGEKQQALQASKRQHDAAMEGIEASRAEVTDAERRLQQIADDRRGLDRDSFDVSKRLHPQMPELIAAVKKNERSFRSPPIGPLGSYVKMKAGKEEYAEAAEAALGGLRGLSQFVVAEKEDEELLCRLARGLQPGPPNVPSLSSVLRVFRRPREARFSARRIEVTQRAQNPHLARFDVVLEVINVEDDHAFNAIVDISQPEARLLIPTEEEAREALHKTRLKFPQGGPTRVQSVVIENGTTYAVDKQGLEERRPLEAKVGNVLCADVSHLKRDLEKQQREAAEELKQCKARLTEAERAMERDVKSEVAGKKEVKTLQKQLSDAKARARQAVEQGEFDPAAQEIEESRSEIASLESSLRVEQEKLAKAQAEVTKLEAALGDRRNETCEVQERFSRLNELYQEKSSEVAALTGPVSRAKHGLRKFERAGNEAKAARDAAKKEGARLRDEIDRLLPEVEAAVGERVEDPQQRSEEEIKREIEKLQARQRKQEKKHGGKTLSSLEELARKTQEVSVRKREELDGIKLTTKGTQENFDERYKFWRKSCKAKGKQAALDFNGRLTRKGHAGNLDFNHREEKLSLQVVRNSQDAHAAGTTDARNLSGGERSFTTLAFQLSMWEFMETPFRVLDEFDVFMDDTYRKIAVDALLELTSTQQHRQFIFLTPQDMHPFLKGRANPPHVIKMKDVR